MFPGSGSDLARLRAHAAALDPESRRQWIDEAQASHEWVRRHAAFLEVVAVEDVPWRAERLRRIALFESDHDTRLNAALALGRLDEPGVTETLLRSIAAHAETAGALAAVVLSREKKAFASPSGLVIQKTELAVPPGEDLPLPPAPPGTHPSRSRRIIGSLARPSPRVAGRLVLRDARGRELVSVVCRRDLNVVAMEIDAPDGGAWAALRWRLETTPERDELWRFRHLVVVPVRDAAEQWPPGAPLEVAPYVVARLDDAWSVSGQDLELRRPVGRFAFVGAETAPRRLAVRGLHVPSHERGLDIRLNGRRVLRGRLEPGVHEFDQWLPPGAYRTDALNTLSIELTDARMPGSGWSPRRLLGVRRLAWRP